jgi:hypothetical protein
MTAVLLASGGVCFHTVAFSGSGEPSPDPLTVPIGEKWQDLGIIPDNTGAGQLKSM